MFLATVTAINLIMRYATMKKADYLIFCNFLFDIFFLQDKSVHVHEAKVQHGEA